MTTTPVTLWAGKRLSADEEARTRRLVAFLHRAGDPDTASTIARFLPEHDHSWTPDELEAGAHTGPWMVLDQAETEEGV